MRYREFTYTRIHGNADLVARSWKLPARRIDHARTTTRGTGIRRTVVLLHPPLFIHLEDDDLFHLAPFRLEAAFLRLGLALALLPTRRLAQFGAAAVDHRGEAFAAALSRRQLPLAIQLQLAPAVGQRRLARVLTDAMHFLDVQIHAVFRQLLAGHLIRGQQGGLPTHLTYQRGTFAFLDAQHRQFRIHA